MNALDIATEPKVEGYRNAIMVLRDLAALVEQHPEIELPSVAFGKHSYAWSNSVSFNCWGTSMGQPDDWYKLPYEERKEREKQHKRDSIVRQINTIIDAFPSITDWTPNDPSADSTDSYAKSYYVVTGTWGNVQVKIAAQREMMGEEVQVMYAGPQVTMQDGSIQALRQTLTVWKPNPDLSARIMDPARMLESASAGPVLQELTATEVIDGNV